MKILSPVSLFLYIHAKSMIPKPLSAKSTLTFSILVITGISLMTMFECENESFWMWKVLSF